MKKAIGSIIGVIIVVSAVYYGFQANRTPVKQIPLLTGLTENQARSRLSRIGFDNVIVEPTKSTARQGAIVGQEPAAGDVARAAAEVVLYVAAEDSSEEFYGVIGPFLDDLTKKIQSSAYADAKIAVISGTLLQDKQNVRFSQLELLVMKSLREHLASSGLEVAEISREDWIFLKLPEIGTPGSVGGDMLFLETDIHPSAAAGKLRIGAWGFSVSGGKRSNTNIVSSITLDYSRDGYISRIYEESPAFLPLPAGTREKPYEDIDQMAKIMVAEAIGALPSDKTTAVDVKAHGGAGNDAIPLIESAIKSSLAEHMPVVAGHSDFRRLVERLTFEQRNEEFSLPEKPQFARADINIFLDLIQVPADKQLIRISMRAFWLHTESAGQAVQGFKGVGFIRAISERELAIDASLNKRVFRTGDRLELEVQPRGKSCFVWVYNFLADERILLLFPRRKNAYNFFHSGEKARIPPENEDYRLEVYADEPGAEEALQIVAVDHHVDLPDIRNPHTFEVTRSEYERWVNAIPEQDRTTVRIDYAVKSE